MSAGTTIKSRLAMLERCIVSLARSTDNNSQAISVLTNVLSLLEREVRPPVAAGPRPGPPDGSAERSAPPEIDYTAGRRSRPGEGRAVSIWTLSDDNLAGEVPAIRMTGDGRFGEDYADCFSEITVKIAAGLDAGRALRHLDRLVDYVKNNWPEAPPSAAPAKPAAPLYGVHFAGEEWRQRTCVGCGGPIASAPGYHVTRDGGWDGFLVLCDPCGERDAPGVVPALKAARAAFLGGF